MIELDKKDSSSIKSFSAQMRNLKIKNIICPHESFRSAWMLRSLKAERKIAYRSWWNQLFFTDRLEKSVFLPEALRALQLLTVFDFELKSQWDHLANDKEHHNSQRLQTMDEWSKEIPESASMLIPVSAENASLLLHRFHLKSPFVILAPSSQWATKRWTSDGYAELTRLLCERGFNIYYVGTLNETEHLSEILKKVGNNIPLNIQVKSFAGETSLIELHAMMSLSSAVIANDSGPMHMAAASGCPVVGIFGPTTLSQGYRPWTDFSIVVQKNINCRPCGRHGHNKCPINTHECMVGISANEVVAAFDKLLKRVQ